MSQINFIHGDCMNLMKDTPDKFYDLAIVDPPYGMRVFGASSRIKKYGQMRTVNDMPPDPEYFEELMRVSKNQIIWGGNNFNLPPTRGFIFWYKHQPLTDYAAGEYAWTSFDRNARCLDLPFYGGSVGKDKDGRIHPTQKPVALYKWLLSNYLMGGGKVLDTHLGSGSIAIACHDMGFDLTATEIDPEYYQAAVTRFENHKKQLRLSI